MSTSSRPRAPKAAKPKAETSDTAGMTEATAEPSADEIAAIGAAADAEDEAGRVSAWLEAEAAWQAEQNAELVTCVVAERAFTAAYGTSLIDVPAGRVIHGDLAVYLAGTGAPVRPATDEDLVEDEQA